MRLILLPVLLGLSACAPFPEAQAPQRLASPAEAPALLPLDQLVAQAGEAQITPAITGSVEARAAALRARAATMQSEPLQGDTTGN